MALNRTYISTSEKLETAIIQHLRFKGGFKGCAIVAHGFGLEAPETLPCLVVQNETAERYGDVPDELCARQAIINCSLYADSEETTQAKFEKYAREMEAKMYSTTLMQEFFNPPASGRDKRKIRGLYLHDVTDWTSEASTEGTTWQYTVSVTLVFQTS